MSTIQLNLQEQPLRNFLESRAAVEKALQLLKSEQCKGYVQNSYIKSLEEAVHHLTMLVGNQVIIQMEETKALKSTDSHPHCEQVRFQMGGGDTHKIYDPKTGIITIPIRGWYKIKFNHQQLEKRLYFKEGSTLNVKVDWLLREDA
jgi:hypothetical protein